MTLNETLLKGKWYVTL